MQLGLFANDRWQTTSINMPRNLQLIVFTPTTTMNTSEARAMLPPKISRSDAVFNISRTGLLINAMVTGNLDDLRIATEDKLHQPIRGASNVMPWLNPCVKAALEAGAKGAFLSGAGSSIMAIAAPLKIDRHAQCREERKDRAIAVAMQTAAESVDIEGRVFITRSTERGAYVKAVETDLDATETASTCYTYRSTRDSAEAEVSFQTAVMAGLAGDGGLFVPTNIPKIDKNCLARWRNLSYADLALEIMSKFIKPSEIPRSHLRRLIANSYG